MDTAEVEVGDDSVIHLDLVPQTSTTLTIEVELETMSETLEHGSPAPTMDGAHGKYYRQRTRIAEGASPASPSRLPQ